MTGTLLEGLVKLTIFTICAQMLIRFRSRQVYEKYLRLLANLLILLQLLLPVHNLLLGGDGDALLREYGLFMERMEQSLENMAWREYEKWLKEGEGIPGDEEATPVETEPQGISRVEIETIRVGGKNEP